MLGPAKVPLNAWENMTGIRLYNTKTRKKEAFTPLDPDNLRMYVCGPTVYDRAHIGNARPVIVFDVLNRLLRQVYGSDHVTYVRNFTDVDDKINARAAKSGRSIREITDETIAWYHDDMDALGNLRPDMEPRATEYIAQMIAMTSDLIASGHAYAAEGHVLFDVHSYENYGSLSGRSVDDMIAGARVEVAPYKRDPMDFVLWKPSADDLPGWDSPWGRGRPGWHIECSAMSRELLGPRFDIHGGGLDLAFPHHENEKAQSCCTAGEDSFAQVWMHNEMLQVEGRKMSKSLGNFFSVRELLDRGYPGEVIRFVFLSTHYRKPMDWTEKKAREADETLKKWCEKAGESTSAKVAQGVLKAIADDLNTPRAMSELHRLFSIGDYESLTQSALLLGIDLRKFKAERSLAEVEKQSRIFDENLTPLLEAVLAARAKAKSEKRYADADAIRTILENAGIELADSKDGTSFRVGDNYDSEKLRELRHLDALK